MPRPKKTPTNNTVAPPPQKTIEQLTAEANANLDQQKVDAEQEVKKPRKPRPSEIRRKALESAVDIPIEVIEGVVGLPFDIIAARRGDTWKLSDDERFTVASGVKTAADAYLPAIAEKWLPLIVALSSIASVIYLKIEQEKAAAANKPKAAELPVSTTIDTEKIETLSADGK